MRVISGTAKGRKLYCPKTHPRFKLSGTGNIRPALDKVKGAIFNILQSSNVPMFQGSRVLDLFAGTGAIGIEALSRGAAHATFVDDSREAITIIRKNIELCGFQERAKIFPKRVDIALEYFAKHGEKFDLIFVDPPYLKDLVNPTLEMISTLGILADGGQIVVEHHPKEPILSSFRTIEPSGNRTIEPVDQRKYGQTSVSFLAMGILR